MSEYVKDPQATLDYAFDWSAWLAQGETITAHTVTATPTGLGVDTSSNDDTTVTAWLSGGEPITVYAVVCRITTTGGRVDERTMHVRVQNR